MNFIQSFLLPGSECDCLVKHIILFFHNNKSRKMHPHQPSQNRQGHGGSTENSPLLNPIAVRKSSSSSSRSVSPNELRCANDLRKNARSESKNTRRRMLFVIALALVFFVAELVGGYLSNSLALMSDAFHLLTDVISFIMAFIAIILADKPATERHSFGFHRAEVIAALVSVFTIWVLTGFLVSEAIERLQTPKEIDGRTMFIIAAIGVVINIILAAVLGHNHDHNHGGNSHGHDHAHSTDHIHDNHHFHSNPPKENQSHNHDHNDSSRIHEPHLLASKPNHPGEKNINLRAATLHVIGDLISSIGVLISSVIIMVDPTKTFVDPICTFIFSGLVLLTTYHVVRDSLAILMEGTPTHIIPSRVTKSLEDIPGVSSIHDLHIWTLTAGKLSLAVHIVIAEDSLQLHSAILLRAQHIVCDEYGIHHSTIQVETAEAGHCYPGMCATVEGINNEGSQGAIGDV